MQKLWVDLDKYGIELKKIQTPDGNVFPLMIINNVEKYNESDAISLEALKDPNNPTGFVKLPGERKGRNSNTPMYMLTKSLKNGVSEYNIKNSLSQLLNIPEESVKQLYVNKEESEFLEHGSYADFQKFNQVIEQSTQRFYGSILYIVKDKAPAENLIDFSQKLIDQQHGLFPKNTVENIPFRTLDSFGVNSSIIDKAFMNPDDALKQGYTLNKLTSLKLNGDRSVLPVSINSDNSVNIILDPDKISPLAYSNYHWQKNFPLIEDYNALVSVREATRSLLNAKAINIPDSKAMEKHIESMALAFQNFNASQTAIKLHKPIKFNQNGVYTFLAKNNDGDWRYIEKEGFKKRDEPLTWTNYKKAIQKLADHNNVVSAALELKVLEGTALSTALDKVFKNQEQLFKKYVKVVNGPEAQEIENKIIINEAGKKIHNQQFDASTRKFQRDVGKQMENEQILSTIRSLTQIPDAGNIRNTMGDYVDGFSLAESVVEVEDPEYSQDILAIYERSIANGRKVENIEDNLRAKDTTLDNEKRIAQHAILVSDSNAQYENLPKKMSPLIDQKYNEVNAIFKVMQRINLSDIPYWEKQIEEAQQLKQRAYSLTNEQLEQNINNAVNNGGSLSEISQAAKIPDNYQRTIDLADQTITDLNNHLDKERVKANILQYQFAKFLATIDSPTYGNMVFNKDADGNFIPFETKVEYDNACKLVENGFTKSNTENGSLVLDNSDIRQQVNAFVDANYKGEVTEFNNIVESIELLTNSAKSQLQFVDIDVQPISQSYLSNDLRNTLFNDVIDNVNTGLDSYSKTADSSKLDEALLHVSNTFHDVENKSGLPVVLANTYLNKLLERYQNQGDNPQDLLDPLTGVKLSDRAKIDAIKELGALSFSSLRGVDNPNLAEIRNDQIVFSENLAHAYTQNERKLNNLDVNGFQQSLAAEFSLLNINEPASNATLSNARFGLKLEDSQTPYKIIKFDVTDQETDVSKVLHASNFKDAKKEAFAMLQMNTTGGMLGIPNDHLNKIATISQAIIEGDENTVKTVSTELMGIEFTTNDLLNMTYSQNRDSSKVGNKDYLIQTPDAGTLKFDPINGFDLLNQTALIHKLTQNETKFNASPLVENINQFESFNAVQKYLAIGDAELHELTSLNSNKATSLELASAMADHSIDQFRAFNKANTNPPFANNQFYIVTPVPKVEGDQPYSRVIPVDWVANLNQLGRNFVDLNISPLGSINASDGKVDHQKLSTAINQHVSIGDGISNIPSQPIYLDAILNNPTQPLQISEKQKSILLEGGLDGLRTNAYSKESNDALLAAANFEVALTNMPSNLKLTLVDQFHEDGNAANVNLRLSMSKQKGIEIPQLAITSAHDRVPLNHITVQQISTHELASVLQHSDLKYNSENGQFTLPVTDTTKLADVINLHNKCLEVTGFDQTLYHNRIMEKFQVSQPQTHQEFLKNFSNENLTIDKIEATYAKLLIDGIDQAKRNGFDKDEIYLSFGKEKFLPQLLLTTKPSFDSVSIETDLKNADIAQSVISSLNISVNLLPKDAVIDQLQPIALPNDQINETSLALVRQNFIEQFNQKADITVTNSQISETIDNAKLYSLNDGENTTFALASSKSKVMELINSGATAVINDISATTNMPAKNILARIVEPSEVQKANLISFISNLPVNDKPEASLNAITVLAPFKDATDTTHKLQTQASIDLAAQTEQKAQFNTEFAEPLLSKFTPNQVMNMSGVEIAENIKLDKIWPKVDMGLHVESQHQNLDTMILARTIRNILPTSPDINDDATLTTQASSYVQLINEVHKGVSTAKTADELIDNIQKAVYKTKVYNADYLTPENISHAEDFENLVKAANQKNKEGVSLNQALTDAIIKAPHLQPAFNSAIKEAAELERLVGSEKSFINYMNGPVLNAKDSHIAELNTSLVSRMVDNRNLDVQNLGAFEMTKSNTVISPYVFNSINAKATNDYDSSNAVNQLKNQWGLNIQISPEEKIFEKGYIDITDKAFNKLHTILGGDSVLPKQAMALGETTVEFGSYRELENANFLSIAAADPDKSYTILSNQWVQNLAAKIEQNEIRLMEKDELSKYREFVVSDERNGLIGYIETYGYKPKTDALNQLSEIHEYLKNGANGPDVSNTSDQLLHHASKLEIQKSVEFKKATESFDSYDDDMRHRTFIVENYASQYVADMSAKQDEQFKKIESKLATISNNAKDANDLYDFNVVASALDKVTNIPLPTSKSVIDKYADKVKDSTVAKEEGYTKEDIVSEITSNLENRSPIFVMAQDLLAARASHKFIQMMDKYAPENTKNSSEYIVELNKYFNLGESGDVKPSTYNTEFGKHLEKLNEKEQLYADVQQQIAPDFATIQYLATALDDSNPTSVPTPELNPSEKTFAIQRISTLAATVSNVEAPISQKQELIKKNAQDFSYE